MKQSAGSLSSSSNFFGFGYLGSLDLRSQAAEGYGDHVGQSLDDGIGRRARGSKSPQQQHFGGAFDKRMVALFEFFLMIRSPFLMAWDEVPFTLWADRDPGARPTTCLTNGQQ